MNAIETHGLAKQYGSFTAVKNISLSVPQGSVYGFLGPNGAGKSTTIKMFMGFIRPTGGSASILGLDIRTQHKEICMSTGYLPERPAFYDDMAGKDNIIYFGKLLGAEGLNEKADGLLKMVGLDDRGNDRVKTYSHGMRQRLGIAVALLGSPRLLILDEPTTGLDPQGSHDIRDIITKLKREDITIFLSSHILHEVEEVCDTVGIIKNGSLIVQKKTCDFLRSMDDNLAVIEITSPAFEEGHVRLVERIRGVESVTRNSGSMIVRMDDPAIAEEVNIALVNAGCRVRSIKEAKHTLEDAFLKATGNEIKEG
jgi:ABC-2 type transport system ATP-binding protein